MKIKNGTPRRSRFPDLGLEVLTSVVPAVVHQILDLPAEPLAAVIGSWPRPALLESGPGFGEAGRWSILAAYPRLVWEATGSHWSLHTDSGAAESGEGDVLTVLGRSVAAVPTGRTGRAS